VAASLREERTCDKSRRQLRSSDCRAALLITIAWPREANFCSSAMAAARLMRSISPLNSLGALLLNDPAGGDPLTTDSSILTAVGK